MAFVKQTHLLITLTCIIFLLNLARSFPLSPRAVPVIARSDNVGDNNMGSGNIGNNNVGDNNVGDNNVGNNNQGNNNKDSPDAGDSSDSDDDDICSNTDKIRTYVRFSDRKLKWGEASPWDVIGYLDSPDHQGPCTAPSSVAGENFTSCDNDEWTAMPTTLTTGMNFQETHLKITVDRSTTFGPGTFRAYKAALQEALREYNQGEMVDWWSSTRSCSSTGIGMGCFGSQQLKNSGIEPDGTKAQNTNTAGLSIDRYNGQTPCGHFRLDFAVDGQDPESGDQEACKATLLGLTGFAAAASALLPPMAILAGFFGAMQLVCDNFD